MFGIYVIKDTVTGQYGSLMLKVNEAQAVRDFDLFCKESKISKDLQLYYCGTYNSDNGFIMAQDPTFIKNGGIVNA